ncbi:MAG: hypothetical protein WD381_00855 [Balneolaceae bacterium]
MENSKHFLYLFFFGWIIFSSCQSTEQVTQPDNVYSDHPSDYSVVMVIHGDSDYLFHENGKAFQADEEVLKDAISAAKEAETGEFFIFHQKQQRKILWLFKKDNRQFYHYKNGSLVHQERYKVGEEITPFQLEGDLYQKHASISTEQDSNYFFYFGHEIPLDQKTGYHRSYPSINFSLHTFTEAVDQFTTDALPKFSLIALSTCNNGSPDMVTQLSTKTDYLLASSQNLHLSHFDLSPLHLLEDEEVRTHNTIGREIAEKTYQRLSESTQTAVTLSLYSMDKLDNYLNSMYAGYQQYLRDKDRFASENTDCRTIEELNFPNPDEGVQQWYRAPQFGPQSNVDSHSGWGCKYID